MTSKKFLYIAGVSFLAASAGWSQGVQSAVKDRSSEATVATPLGVTLEMVSGGGRGRGAGRAGGANGTTADRVPAGLNNEEEFRESFFNGGPERRVGSPIALADANGKTLYTYDRDTVPGKSACVGDCAKAWPPLLVSPNAKPIKNWSVITRNDGAKQWAYKTKPLYTFAKDTEIAQRNGDGMVDGAWHMARFDPVSEVTVPPGISVTELVGVNGYGLANKAGLTIYALKDHGGPTSYANSRWIPVTAAELASPMGEFMPISPKDGGRQWSYKGDPLFTYEGDLASGETMGVGVDKRFDVVKVVDLYMPSEATIRFDHARGPVLVTAKGMTIYKRDNKFHQVTGHGLPHSFTGDPAVGRDIGTKGCDSECLKSWRPFFTSKGALPSGYWNILARPDGTRQWSYKGFALYTYTGDKKPGDRIGHEILDIMSTEDLHENIYDKGPVLQYVGAGLLWHYVEP